MKTRVLALFLVFATPAATAAPAGHARHGASTMGVHGMVLFGGRDGLFASHLPLFRAPHDRRVLIEVALDDPKLDRELRARLDARPELWTIEPERFELARLSAGSTDPLTAFRGDLFRGHFERGGEAAYRGAGLKVVRVIEDRALDARPATKATATYRTVGRGRTVFLVKDVDARPDFDHVVALAPGSKAPTGTVAVAREGVEAPSLTALSAAARAKAVATIYYDTADLR